MGIVSVKMQWLTLATKLQRSDGWPSKRAVNGFATIHPTKNYWFSWKGDDFHWLYWHPQVFRMCSYHDVHVPCHCRLLSRHFFQQSMPIRSDIRRPHMLHTKTLTLVLPEVIDGKRWESCFGFQCFFPWFPIIDRTFCNGFPLWFPWFFNVFSIVSMFYTGLLESILCENHRILIHPFTFLAVI